MTDTPVVGWVLGWQAGTRDNALGLEEQVSLYIEQYTDAPPVFASYGAADEHRRQVPDNGLCVFELRHVPDRA